MGERLDHRQIAIMESLIKRGGSVRAVSLDRKYRERVVPLWRRGLIEVWYRQNSGGGPSLQGPYYGLTIAGAKLASHFLHPAPRGFSGAGNAT